MISELEIRANKVKQRTIEETEHGQGWSRCQVGF